jgi:hypothetical protein
VSRRPNLPARSALLALVWASLLAGCLTPATGRDSYRGKAFMSVTAATSEVATTALTVRLMRRDRILGPYADETVTGSETALGSIATAFESVQPPAGDDKVRDDVSSLLSDAQDAVSAARIAVRRHDDTGLAKAADDLRKVSSDLSKAAGQLS